jgi:hypothetical protein
LHDTIIASWCLGNNRHAIKIVSLLPGIIIVLELVSKIRDVVLMNVYLDLGSPGGAGFWNKGYMSKGREMERSFYEQPGNKVDGSCHSKEGSK